MNATEFTRVFPLGSHLCREPMPPMAELKADMENLARHGFNLVKLQENWMLDEPLEGCYDFSRYEELVDHAARLDMGVYLGLTCEQAPGWLWRKHPGCRMVGRNGLPIAYEAQTTLPADAKPGPCYDHAGAMEDQLRFIRQLVKTLGRYENIVIWNTWQEIGYWPIGLAGQDVCYCENTFAAFRRWLQGKYGDLDGLNRAWNARYPAWDSVVPDRLAQMRYPQPNNIDWHYFIENVQIGNILVERARAIREADPLDRPVFAHKGGPLIGAGQDWTYARCQDFLGSSCYPAWHTFNPWDDGHPAAGQPLERHAALLTEMWDGVALKFDYIRCCNPPGSPVWAAEFQGGPVSTGFHKGRVPSPGDIRRWMLTAAGCGVTALSFWVTRAEIHVAEANGFSLLDSAGETTPRYEEAARIGRALNAHGELFNRPTRPRSDVAIFIDEWNYQLTNLMAQGHEHLPYDVRGWYRLLWDLNIPVDFIEASELDEPYVQDYRALILPFPLSISEAIAGKLVRYVEAGGNLVSEAGPGRVNEHGYCTRGELSPALAALFGVRQTSFTMIHEPGGALRWSPPPRTWGEYLEPALLAGDGPLAGHRLRANVYLETYDLADGAALLRAPNGVAGAVRRSGQGAAWLLGTYVGHSGTAHRDPETFAAVRALLGACGVAPQHHGRLLLRKRTCGEREAWFFTNPTAEAVTEDIAVAGWNFVADLLAEPVTRAHDAVRLTVEPLDVRVLVLARE